MIGICESTGMFQIGKVPGPAGRFCGQELAVEIAGDAERQDVDHRAADDLVGLEFDGHDRVEPGQ